MLEIVNILIPTSQMGLNIDDLRRKSTKYLLFLLNYTFYLLKKIKIKNNYYNIITCYILLYFFKFT